MSFSFSFNDPFADADDPCGDYEPLLRTSTGEWTTFQQDVETPDGTNDVEWLSYGIDLTS